MVPKDTLFQEIEDARLKFMNLLESIPETDYPHPTENPVWSVGNVLQHITLGPRAMAAEIWMILHAPWLFQAGLDCLPPGVFNHANSRLARSRRHTNRQELAVAYEKSHATIVSRLHKTLECDLQRSIRYPASLVSNLGGPVTVERLFRQVKLHFLEHEQSLSKYRASAHVSGG